MKKHTIIIAFLLALLPCQSMAKDNALFNLLRDAAFVAVGDVISTQRDAFSKEPVFTVAISRGIKGELPQTVDIKIGPDFRDYLPHEGDTYLLFLKADENPYADFYPEELDSNFSDMDVDDLKGMDLPLNFRDFSLYLSAAYNSNGTADDFSPLGYGHLSATVEGGLSSRSLMGRPSFFALVDHVANTFENYRNQTLKFNSLEDFKKYLAEYEEKDEDDLRETNVLDGFFSQSSQVNPMAVPSMFEVTDPGLAQLVNFYGEIQIGKKMYRFTDNEILTAPLSERAILRNQTQRDTFRKGVIGFTQGNYDTCSKKYRGRYKVKGVIRYRQITYSERNGAGENKIHVRYKIISKNLRRGWLGIYWRNKAKRLNLTWSSYKVGTTTYSAGSWTKKRKRRMDRTLYSQYSYGLFSEKRLSGLTVTHKAKERSTWGVCQTQKY